MSPKQREEYYRLAEMHFSNDRSVEGVRYLRRIIEALRRRVQVLEARKGRAK